VDAEKAGGIDVVVKTIQPGALRGRLVSLTADDGLTLETDGRNLRIPYDDLVRLRAIGAFTEGPPHRASDPSPSAAQTPAFGVTALVGDDVRIALVGGDVLLGRIADGPSDADLVAVRTSAYGSVNVPLNLIAGLDTTRAALPTFADSVGWLDSPKSGLAMEDRVLLTNADVVRGFVTGLDADGLSIDNGSGEARLPHRLIVAVRFASLAEPPEDGPRAIVTCPASGRLTLTDLDWSGWRLRGRWRGAVDIEVDARDVTRVDFAGGRWEWLSDHTPISVEQVPMLSLSWTPQVDRNVLGGPLRVAGENFEHGIGVHSRSRLTFDLQGRYREFVTLLGIDDDSGPFADVDVFIRVDGDQKYGEQGVRRGRLYGPVRLDVTDAKRIELGVDFGKAGGIQDRFDWIEPALIK